MSTTAREHLVSTALAVTVFAQACLLPAVSSGRELSLALVLSAWAAQTWLVRRLLPAHVDMLVLMGGFGGLGMLLGTRAAAGTAAACHPSSGAVWLGMFAGMLAAGLPPVLAWARCLQGLPWRARLLPVLLDLLGMTAGMTLGHVLLRELPIDRPALHHIVMIVGMLLGMAAAIPLRHSARVAADRVASSV